MPDKPYNPSRMKGVTNLKQCTIRSERITDYQSISDVNAAAFTYSYGMGEVTLINVFRSRRAFDPDLSLVAELDNRIIGHVLFTPQQVFVGDKLLDAVILAPIAVYPEFQNKGIGTVLIEEGHKRAKEKGFHFSLLLGHPGYYPRFGYLSKMWSNSNVLLPVNEIPLSSKFVKERRIHVTDLESLNGMWEIWNQGIDMAFKPESSITSWISPGKGIQASAIEVDGNFSGYLRYGKDNPGRILNILARDSESLMEICAYIKSKLVLDNTESKFLFLPISPESCERNQVTLDYQTEVNSGPEKMLKILNDNSSITDYCEEVISGKRAPGNIIWPVEFDVC
ncbi:GNAT family N-acetyltransferase [Paenibacillus sp. Soil522]|uniref:GNAT family N-acetyltransferase n=1 Tax=Paenibacillus sp. Soil522 TaxID=1736388 RepID=UPI0009D7816A|nr:N-acetyltransferase [Paenibacillus sp. Soil522]